MFTRRRAAEFGVVTLLMSAFLIAPPAPRADEPAKVEPQRDEPSDRVLRRRLEDAADAIRASDWSEAAMLLQSVLRAERSPLLTVMREDGGRERPVVVSARREAERLLASLPEAGRRLYEKTYGPKAAEDFHEARTKKSAALLQRVVDQYLYTNAGVEALAALAALHADAGRYDRAALLYKELMRHRGMARWTPAQLIQAVISLRSTDDVEEA
jgi:hypothetical protein